MTITLGENASRAMYPVSRARRMTWRLEPGSFMYVTIYVLIASTLRNSASNNIAGRMPRNLKPHSSLKASENTVSVG